MNTLRLIATVGACCLAVATSCNKEGTCRAVFGEGATINLEDPKWHALNTIGNAVTVNRGLKGIYVTRKNLSGSDQFSAFECACTNDNDDCLLPDTEANFPDIDDHYGSAVLRCPKCNATFETYNGQPLGGSQCPLYQYSTAVDGYLLTIY